MIPKSLGPYEIKEPLGKGGMGEVYRARDTRLEREVAVKLLPDDLAADPEHLARFEQEAKLLASLNHPGIATIHSVEEAEGTRFLVMELVEGTTLEERLRTVAAGSLPVPEALRLAGQVAAALETAHERGIIHRDLKPSNVMLTEGGGVKLLDFGVAKALQGSRGEGSGATEVGTGLSPTERATELTAAGALVGTLPYASPEQARGKEVDERSDVWAFGCLLYEMLAGASPFSRPTRADTVGAILEHEPDWGALPEGAPPLLRSLLRRCLQKDPRRRTGNLREVRLQVEEALEEVRRRRPSRESGRSPERQAGIAEPDASRPNSIAVLPFANMSADPDNEYFADGITEDIINALTQVEELRVASRTSAFAFKGKKEDIRKIGEALNVGTVLEGSVRKASNRLRITAQLIEVENGYHLWSERYDRELEDVFAVQDEISHAIVETLTAKLVSQGHPVLAKRQTTNLDAYDLYLKGRYLWNRRGEGLFKAQEYFAEAIEEDSNYAHAHAALADTYNLMGWYRFLAPQEAFSKANQAARRAIELDERLAEAHTSLAFVLTYHDWAWEEAERQYARAMELNPGYATAHHWYAEHLMAVGRLGEALAEAKQAQELDPLGLIINMVVAYAHYFARQYDNAISECRKTIEMDPTFAPAYLFLGLAQIQKGMYEEAVRSFEQEARRAGGRSTTRTLAAVAHALGGRTDEAKRLLESIEGDRGGKEYVSAFDVALIHFAFGDDDLGFEWLERAYAERSCWLVFLRVDPMLDSLHEDPRYQSLLGRMNLDRPVRFPS